MTRLFLCSVTSLWVGEDTGHWPNLAWVASPVPCLILLLLLLLLLLLCSWTRAYVASLPKNRPVVTIGPCGRKYFPVSSLVGNLLEYFGIQVKYECHCCLAANSRIGIYNGNWFLTDNSTTVSQILMVFSADPMKFQF